MTTCIRTCTWWTTFCLQTEATRRPCLTLSKCKAGKATTMPGPALGRPRLAQSTSITRSTSKFQTRSILMASKSLSPIAILAVVCQQSIPCVTLMVRSWSKTSRQSQTKLLWKRWTTLIIHQKPTMNTMSTSRQWRRSLRRSWGSAAALANKISSSRTSQRLTMSWSFTKRSKCLHCLLKTTIWALHRLIACRCALVQQTLTCQVWVKAHRSQSKRQRVKKGAKTSTSLSRARSKRWPWTILRTPNWHWTSCKRSNSWTEKRSISTQTSRRPRLTSCTTCSESSITISSAIWTRMQPQWPLIRTYHQLLAQSKPLKTR